jgi:hypothetical protein
MFGYLSERHVVPLVLLCLPRAAMGLRESLIRLGGWADLAGQVYAEALASHAGFVAADEYGLASELAWRLQAPPVLATEPRWRLFRLPLRHPSGPGLLVRSERRAGGPDAADWAEARPLGELVRQRHGVVAERYRLFIVLPRPAPQAAALPHRG